MSDVKPVRLRLSRQKGFDLQTLSQATNGLRCVVVSRPSAWGNPYRVVKGGRFIDTGEPCWAGRQDWELDYPWSRTRAEAAERAVEGFRNAVATGKFIRNFDLLRGKNLACWCAKGEPCHADVLLELANAPAGRRALTDAEAEAAHGD